MRHLNGVYTQRFNRKHERVGYVFQGRFKAILVEMESYLLELARYIVLNPCGLGWWVALNTGSGAVTGSPLVWRQVRRGSTRTGCSVNSAREGMWR